MEFHSQDLARLKRCRVDVTNPEVIEAYRRLRQIMVWTDQVGPLPFTTLIDLALKFGPWEAPKASQGAESEAELKAIVPVHKQNGKPKAKV
jgi:hypothetical protein